MYHGYSRGMSFWSRGTEKGRDGRAGMLLLQARPLAQGVSYPEMINTSLECQWERSAEPTETETAIRVVLFPEILSGTGITTSLNEAHWEIRALMKETPLVPLGQNTDGVPSQIWWNGTILHEFSEHETWDSTSWACLETGRSTCGRAGAGTWEATWVKRTGVPGTRQV